MQATPRMAERRKALSYRPQELVSSRGTSRVREKRGVAVRLLPFPPECFERSLPCSPVTRASLRTARETRAAAKGRLPPQLALLSLDWASAFFTPLGTLCSCSRRPPDAARSPSPRRLPTLPADSPSTNTPADTGGAHSASVSELKDWLTRYVCLLSPRHEPEPLLTASSRNSARAR